MAGKFEITKAGDTFSFELFIDDKAAVQQVNNHHF